MGIHDHETMTGTGSVWHRDELGRPDRGLVLVIAWSRQEPDRVGELALLSREPQVLGRGATRTLSFFRFRPASSEVRPPLGSPRISRTQLRVGVADQALQVENIGRRKLLHNAVEVQRATVRAGDTLEIEGELLLVCVRRPLVPPAAFDGVVDFPFGQADPWGMVGESAAMWELRRQLGFLGPRDEHILVLGDSGTGKELVAGALHALSSRAARPMVSRNAATLPEGLIDAELFGNTRNYPNPGMPERRGIVGEAHRSTLFLDEIGEVPAQLQAHLLRVLDSGEYTRLGEATARRADLRLVAATNRDPSELRHDLAPRLKLRVAVPPLAERVDDIPLLVRHLLRHMGRDPQLADRFFTDEGEPRLDPALLDRLIRHPYTHHIRELEGLLWTALTASTGQVVALSSAVLERLSTRGPSSSTDSAAEVPTGPVDPEDLTAEQLRAALQEHKYNVSATARGLGLSSRYVLYRLLNKHGIEV